MPERELWEAVLGKSRSVKPLTRMIEFKALLAEFHTDFVDRRPTCSWRHQPRIALQSLLLGKYVCFIKFRQPRGGNWLPPDKSHAEPLLASCHRVGFIDYSSLCFMWLISCGVLEAHTLLPQWSGFIKSYIPALGSVSQLINMLRGSIK